MAGITGENWGAIQSLFEELVDLSQAEQSRPLNNATQPPAIVAHRQRVSATSVCRNPNDPHAVRHANPGSERAGIFDHLLENAPRSFGRWPPGRPEL